MIVYQSDKTGFSDDIATGDIESIIEASYMKATGRRVADKELRSWQNSLMYMDKVLGDPDIPFNTGVSIELHIPQTSKRIDFILTGLDEFQRDQAIIIELKQWESAGRTEKDAIVTTFIGGGIREVTHPSYQAWSYAALLTDFNEAVYTGDISLQSCAYLHNYVADDVLTHEFYSEHTSKAPVFYKTDLIKLREFIKKWVRYGDSTDIIYRIDQGKIRPSKMLADSLAKLIKGKPEFIMIDDQKVVFETALNLDQRSEKDEKHVLIVEGGPGTGKSVVAINLLVELTKRGKVALYVTKNAAPRAVYESKLTGVITKSRYSNLFKGSGSFLSTPKDTFDTLIVDEAHRLNEKSGLYQNQGENQIKELIQSSRFTVFFIDEDQRVTFKDIGSKDEIVKWARRAGATIHNLELESQFRCNGSDGYIAWLDHILQIRDTANTDLSDIDFDFRVCESPNELERLIIEKNAENNRSRLVAGYCWDWNSKKNRNAMDIIIPEHNFARKWNLSEDGSLWILKPDSINEIGCIHTCQGLELDYVGVIIGDDLVVRNGTVQVNPAMRSRMDKSISGYKRLLKENPEEARHLIRSIIKNTYRTLMTRGMKGCFIYCTDTETQKYFLDQTQHI